jgi:AAA15 family ATPase/GTPase
MIIELTLENFLSIKDEQTFSMYAEKNLKKHSDNIAYSDTKYATLKSAAIFGANASGKSNLLFAFRAIHHVITDSHKFDQLEEIKCYTPYLLSRATKIKPSMLSVEFWLNECRYKYSISFDRNNIYSESLYFYPNTQPAKIFERTSPSEWRENNGITFGSHYKGGKKQFAYFPNNSYLSIAGSSPESPAFIREVFGYFRDSWSFLTNGESQVSHWEKDETAVKAMKWLMSCVDLGISDFKIKQIEASKEQLDMIKDAPDEVRQHMLSVWTKETVFLHADEEGQLVELSPDLESLGTKRLFQALPSILLALKHGLVAFCDEIESSYHSHIVEFLLKIFHDPEINIHNAQLIFTTHNMALLDSAFMRKDQLWFAEKHCGSTNYTSLVEFDSSLRDNSPFDKWYDEGRLGGIPSINYGRVSEVLKEIVRN